MLVEFYLIDLPFEVELGTIDLTEMKNPFSIVIDIFTEIEMSHRLDQNLQFARLTLTLDLYDMSIIPFPDKRV